MTVSPKAKDKIKSQSRCPIARSIKESDPVEFQKVNVFVRGEEQLIIAFSRRSTEMRYYFEAPVKARIFVEAWDAGMIPEDFELTLDESMLIRKPYRTFLGIQDLIIEHEAPRGPRVRQVIAA